MAGCYGGSKEDRYFEKKLNDYLDSQEVPECCEDCDHEDAKDCECSPDACKTGELKNDEPDYDQIIEDREEAAQRRAERYYP